MIRQRRSCYPEVMSSRSTRYSSRSSCDLSAIPPTIRQIPTLTDGSVETEPGWPRSTGHKHFVETAASPTTAGGGAGEAPKRGHRAGSASVTGGGSRLDPPPPRLPGGWEQVVWNGERKRKGEGERGRGTEAGSNVYQYLRCRSRYGVVGARRGTGPEPGSSRRKICHSRRRLCQKCRPQAVDVTPLGVSEWMRPLAGRRRSPDGQPD